MTALVKTGSRQDDLEIRDWPEPSPDPDQVKLRVEAAGVCGTDIEILRGTWPCRPPVILGHEFCGTVVEVGSRVKGFQPGNRIVAFTQDGTATKVVFCPHGVQR